jgi:phosphoglycolate phosphatase-like HAD superfamily hydrolase
MDDGICGSSNNKIGGAADFKTVIFDMDGVLTSEETYWKAAALTVYEYFYRDYELNPDYCYENADAIRDTVFAGGKTIETVKNMGVNSNWDLAYVTVMASEILRHGGMGEKVLFYEIPEFLFDKNERAPMLYEALASEFKEIFGFEDCSRESAFFKGLMDSFQSWYLGDSLYFAEYGVLPLNRKGEKGLIEDEEPLLGFSETAGLLAYLHNKGYALGIGTGRPFCEISRPLERWGFLKYFSRDRIVSYDDVLNAQKFFADKNEKSGKIFLGKPHPYVFLKAAYGEARLGLSHFQAEKPRENSEVLVVGDALCDLMAARSAGFKFCAVLTGIEGKSAKTYFSDEGADFVIDDAAKLTDIL